MAARNSVHLRLSGLPVLTGADGTAHTLARKDAALLARLALEGACTGATLAAWLWPQAVASSARSNLRQRLSHVAGFALFEGDDPVALSAAVQHDLGLPDDGACSAPARWTQHLLSGWDYSDIDPVQAWLTPWNDRLTAQLRQATQRGVLQLQAAGDSVAALAHASAWLAAQPLDEAALRLVMGLHQRRGDKAAAVAAFDRCAAALDAELGARPEAASRQLLAQLHALRDAGSADSAGSAGAPSAPPLIALMRPPRLVGRDAELSALDAICAAGRVAVLLGDPGAGKSRLLDEWAQGRASALRIGCRPGDEAVPYALLTRLLQTALQAGPPLTAADMPAAMRNTLAHLLWRVSPAWGPLPAQPLHPRGLAPALHWALARACPATGLAEGHTVLIDDLQFADLASLEQLPLLLDTPASAAAAPPTWVLALRAAEVPAVLQAWLAGAVGDSAQTLHLGPLDPTAVQTLLDTLGLATAEARLWAGTLHRHTGGHPLYLLQTLMALSSQGGLGSARALAALGSAMPSAGGTRALVQVRIAQLGAQAQDLLHVAALAGQDFSLTLAAAVLAQTPLALADAWHELEVAHLMHGERIAHDLLADAALQSVQSLQAHAAPAWHADIAAHLADHGGALPRIAAHWRAAARWPEAGRAFAAAAAQIHKQLRQAEEAALLLQAADCHAAAGDPDAEGEALFLLFRAQWARKHRQGIHDSVNRLQALPSTPHTGMWAQITRGIVGFDEEPNDESLALTVGSQALALALGDAPLVLWLMGWEVGSLSWLNRPQQMLDAVQRTLPLIEQLPRDTMACSALSQCGTALEIGGQPAAGLRLIEEAETRYRAR